MDDRFRKIICITTADIAPPILLRRRLSAPETIMRKHILAQQRSSSQDSDRSQNSESTKSCQWPLNAGAGSDPNLAKKRDTDIRKSMLIKRFWENSKLLPFPRTYSEWQYSFGKMKISSPQSTPEHHRGNRNSIFDLSPPHKKISPKHEPSSNIQSSLKRKPSVYDKDYFETGKDIMSEISSRGRIDLNKSEHKLPNYNLDESEDYLMYSSNFSNVTSTDSAANTSRTWEEPATPTINSDSAYTNGFSCAAQVSPDANEDDNMPNQSNNTVQVNSDNLQHVNSTRLTELPIKYQFVIRENSKESNTSYEFIKKGLKVEDVPKLSNESSTQTSETTNLNVISNVHLSESTLNLIFNQVMQDLFQSKTISSEPAEPKLITVQNLPSFNLPKTEQSVQSDVNKISLISEVNVGSPYRSKQTPIVPRLSALPRSTSMEVNISSNDSFDKESDSGSLVDSLEEQISPKDSKMNHDDKLVRGELTLLPDNSGVNLMRTKEVKKSSVFYIPIKNEDMENTKEQSKSEHVSSLLPTKLKEKLLKRQIKREEKKKENKSRSFSKIDSDNGNAPPYFILSSDLPANKQRYSKKRPTLPLIDNKKEKPVDIEKETIHKTAGSQRSSSKYSPTKPKSFWLPKPRIYAKLEKSSLASGKPARDDDFIHPPSNRETKQIDILEIMEIVQPERLLNITPKIKSKIPVLVQKNSTIQKDHSPVKPTFLDFGISQCDPKLDQLIANILIDSLNQEDVCKTYADVQIETDAKNYNRNRFAGKFDSIPEEKQQNAYAMTSENNNPNMIEKAADFLTKQVLENNNLEQNYLTENLESKGKTDNSNIPKGWITFYMLQKNNSPDSTSDEGPNTMATKIPKCAQLHGHKHYGKAKKNRPKETYKDSDYKSEDYFESDCESEPKYKQRRMRQDNKTNNNGWSVTVSGTTNGQPGPDLEMRLKFPQLNQQIPNRLRNRADVGIQKGISSTFPPLPNKRAQHHQNESGFSFEDLCPSKMTAEINKSKQYLKNCESATRHSSVIPAKFEPRPTKTSKQRCMLNRPSNRHFREITAPLDTRNRNLQDILDKFPDLLAVSGNTISRDNKANLSKISERDLKRILSHFNNQKTP